MDISTLKAEVIAEIEKFVRTRTENQGMTNGIVEQLRSMASGLWGDSREENIIDQVKDKISALLKDKKINFSDEKERKEFIDSVIDGIKSKLLKL